MSKLWGGRFSKETNALVHEFNASIGFDVRLYAQDIQGSTAWAKGLVGAGVLNSAEAEMIIAGLNKVRGEFEEGYFVFAPGDEDIHTAVERRLVEIVGTVGGKLHTGRSRNDQVATDFRLWVMSACDRVSIWLLELQKALVQSAVDNHALPLPGYTHLQHAQPVTWGHWILSHFWPLDRDRERFAQARARASVLPLGSAALAGTSFPVDRAALAAALGFTAISQNSLDAVSDRDFAVDFLYAGTLLGLHLSRLAEQLILFNSSEFGFVALDDSYTTGSSLMPQKKNPDTLELTRGKSGRLVGNLVGLLTTLKGLPSTYDKDLQEDKEPLFDTYDTLGYTLPVMSGLIASLQLRPQMMARQLEPSLLATDLADYLVKKGLPFRQAHAVIGQVVRLAENSERPLTDLSLAELQELSPLFAADVAAVFSMEGALASRGVIGGTAPTAVLQQIATAQRLVNDE